MGREPTRRVNIVIGEDQYQALLRQARRNRRSFGSLVREAIGEFTGVGDTVRLGRPNPEYEDAPVSTVTTGQSS